MEGFERSAAIDRAEAIVDAVADQRMPVPVREVWVYGDVALGLDPVERLCVYVTKDILVGEERTATGGATANAAEGAADQSPDPDAIADDLGVAGIGKTVRADWAAANPDLVRANANGHAAPEQCLAAQLLADDEPIHLEVCNASFEDNVTQRLEGARAREDYTQVLDPRGVCLWADGQRSTDAIEKLRAGDLVFPTLTESLTMLGLDDDEAEAAAAALERARADRDGATVRGDVV